MLARGWCSPHYQRWHKWGDVNAPKRPGGAGRVETVHGTATAHNNHGCRCEPCKNWHRTYAREWAANNRDKRVASQLKNRYGISSEDYARMLAEQSGVCAICASPPLARDRLFVDHCHATGVVRALLCRPCNTALGMLKDDPDLLMAAAAYLLRNTDVLGAVK